MSNSSGHLRRRAFLKQSAAVVSAGGAMWSSQARAVDKAASTPGRRPNLLFVFSDQQSYDMLGCYRNEQIHTPRTDRFAEEGVRFTHCFSNAPVCTPYRGILLSGKHPLHNGAFENDIALCPSAGPHFGEVLEHAGYRTGYVGKWHLLGGDRKRPVPHGPLRAGFDGMFYTDNCTTEFRAGHSFYYNDAGDKVIYDQWQPYGQTDQAEAFLQESASDHKPFALFVSWHPPHDHGVKPPPPKPHYDYSHYPPELNEPYRGKKLKLRPGIEDSPQRQTQLRDYYAMCSGIDHAFGRLLDRLDALGLAEDTIVVFTSDHGDMLGSHDAPRPKRPPHDTSSRVPLIIRAPGRLPAGRTSELLIGALDLMPTLVAMLGIQDHETRHGRDLSEAISQGNDDAVDSIPLLMIAWPEFRGVVTRDWTFGIGPEGRRTPFNTVLFDRRKDPHQLDNRFRDTSVRTTRNELQRLTRSWMNRFEDPFVSINDLVKIQPLDAYREPTGEPANWPTAIDLLHRRRAPAA